MERIVGGMPGGLPRPAFLGVVHLRPLPGSPRYDGDWEGVVRHAVADLEALSQGGANGAVVENLGDAPYYPDRVPPITVAAMTAATAILRAHAPDSFRIGINVLRNDAAAALAVASVVGASFLRVNLHAGAAVTDSGIVQGRAYETVRLRRQWGEGVAVFADVAVKHAAPLAPRAIEEEARDLVERELVDLLLVTGPRTGAAVERDDLLSVRRAVPDTPLLAASGIDPAGAGALLPHCDGFIVGTWIKREGRIGAPIDVDRVRRIAAIVRRSGP